MSEPRVRFDLTVDQARAVDMALDVYTRLCIGQLEEVAGLVRQNVIPLARESQEGRAAAPCEVVDEVKALMVQVKALLGYPRNGSNGIGHRHVHLTGRQAYEAHKVLAKALAYHSDPEPSVWKGVAYDGLGPRYTNDLAPVVSIQEAENEAL
jgi:hypothetical protein